MPVSDSGVGVSGWTKQKQKHFLELLKWQLNLADAALKKWIREGWNCPSDFRYFDITAGCGKYPDPEGEIITGSPLIFLDTIHSLKPHMEYSATFIDIECDNTSALSKLIPAIASDFVNIISDPFEQVLPTVSLHKNQFGLLYFDPNGVPTPDQLVTLVEFFDKHKRLDFMMHVSTTSWKRVRVYKGEEHLPVLDDWLEQIPKSYWLIRELATADSANKWTFIVGTNGKQFDDYTKAKLHHLNTDIGQQILQQAALTKQEIHDLLQPPLL